MVKLAGFNCCNGGDSGASGDACGCGNGDCGAERTGEQACECIKQDLAERVIPCGTRKMAGQERVYRTTTQLWLTRSEFMAWSKKEGREVDPICWFTEMGHGPIPADIAQGQSKE